MTIPLSVSGTSGASLAEIRRFTAPLIGPYFQSAATSGSTATQLEDATFPIKSTLSQDDLWTDHFLFRPSAALRADQMRVVSSYTPGSGLLLPDLSWTNSAWDSTTQQGEIYELHGSLAPVQDGQSDLHALINAALKRCWVVVELTLQPTSNTQVQVPLASTASWLQAAWQVRQVGRLLTGESRTDRDPYLRPVRGRVEQDGATWYLVLDHAANTSDTLVVRTVKRAYDHCAPAGGTLGSQSGLSLDGDVCAVAAEYAGWGAVTEVWQRHGKRLEMGADQQLLRYRAEAAAQFTKWSRAYFQMPAHTFRPAGRSGPSRWGWN